MQIKYKNKLVSLLYAFPSILPCSKWTKVKNQKLERHFKGFFADTNTIRENILVKFRSVEILSITSFCSPQTVLTISLFDFNTDDLA